MIDFAGNGSPLTQSGLKSVENSAQVGSAEIWSILSVETSGCGFLNDRRPKILFERHIFRRLTKGRYDADEPDVSAPNAGGYGAEGSHQYDRLAAAMRLDRAAALQSASWGLGQILGENFQQAGFDDIEAMVSAMISGEDAQLSAMATFLRNSNMDQLLRTHDWEAFARRYNGRNFSAHHYDVLLNHFYQRFATGQLPDLSVRTVQILLTYKGFPLEEIDGILGSKTISAVKSYQSLKGMSVTGMIDEELIESLVS